MGKVTALVESYVESVTSSPNEALPDIGMLPSGEASQSPPEKRTREEGGDGEEQGSPHVCAKRKREDVEEEKPQQTQFLDLPDDCLYHLFPYLDLASRRALRVNKRLEKIEKKSKFRYRYLQIRYNSFVCDGNIFVFDPKDLKDELKRLNNTHVHRLFCMGCNIREITELVINLNADAIDINMITNEDLPIILNNFKHVFIWHAPLYIAGDGVRWIYENMLDRAVKAKYVRVEMHFNELGDAMAFLDLDEYGEYIPRENQEFITREPEENLTIRERHLFIKYHDDFSTQRSTVTFMMLEEKKEEEGRG